MDTKIRIQAAVRDVPNTGGETMASMPFLTKRHSQGYHDLVEHPNYNLRYHHTDEEILVPSNTIGYSE